VQHKPFGFVPRSKDLHGIARHRWGTRDLGQKPTVRPAELQLAIRLSNKLIPLLVNGPMVPAAEQG
jgi:hypothetical protein